VSCPMVVKQMKCEADHSPPSNVRIKNEWRFTSTRPIVLHGVEIRYSDSFLHYHLKIEFDIPFHVVML